MTELAERFRNEVSERLVDVDRLLDAADGAQDPAASIDGIRDHAHKLKGAAGMFGHNELKESASELEMMAADATNPASLRAAVAQLKLAAQAI